MALSARELCTLTATEAIAAFKAGTLSPVALMEATLARIEAVNPALNAFTEVHAERALDQARAAEAAYARGEARPLEGIPVAIKDFHPVADELTTFGSKAFADHRPERSAPTVARLLDAGGIMHARTTTPEFAYAPITASPLWGVTRNPWSLEHAPGGSSGGRRRGARRRHDGAGGWHRCGRLRPHPGRRLPYRRIQAAVRAQPAGPGSSHRIAAPLRADDAERRRRRSLMQNVMSGAHGDDMCSLKERIVLPESYPPIEGWTVGFSMDLGMFEIDPEVARNTEAAVEVFRRLGCTIREVTPDWAGFDLPHPYLRYWEGMAASSLGGPHGRRVARRDGPLHGRHHRERPRPLGGDALPLQHRAGRDVPLAGADPGGMQRAGSAQRSPCRRWRAEHDCGAEDFRVNGKPVHAYLGWNLCYPFNMVSQCPVIAVPSGLSSDGLPTGIQIVGRTYDDLSVFQAAAAYEAANPLAGRAPAALTRRTLSRTPSYRSWDRAMTDDLLTRRRAHHRRHRADSLLPGRRPWAARAHT